ncbi:unnamed protein product [Oppiella nova]|uniref:AB hydrolase-1 domain-containing protein n=1 Tax=Oppiella nova TaxID=334625 RepID=A0A7R9MBT2_9ACAR|nr:unnamed protein product [Oppiella nova]CAG2174483.1 unnamed protein product [Oppiella nova]
MAGLYGALTGFGTVMQIILKRKSFFTVNDRPKPPACLMDRNLGEHHFIQTKNVKLHYVSKGDPKKPLMLFIHGFPEVWYSWRKQLPVFADNYYTVALNMRGYGDSDKPLGVANYAVDKLVDDIRDVVHGLGKKKCIIVCHDWGGLVGWTTAAQYPELVDKFIVCNAPQIKHFMDTIEGSWKQFLSSWYLPLRFISIHKYIYFFNLPFLPELRFRCNDLQVFDFIFKKLGTKDDIDAYKYYFCKPGALTPPINYYRALQRNYAAHYLNKVKDKRITAPTLVLWGKDDIALTESLAADSCKSCDNYTIKIIDNCSHWTPFDRPDLVNKYIKEFLDKNH